MWLFLCTCCLNTFTLPYLHFFFTCQVVLKSEVTVHSLTLRNVQLNEAGLVKLSAKEFQTEASLIVKGKDILYFA